MAKKKPRKRQPTTSQSEAKAERLRTQKARNAGVKEYLELTAENQIKFSIDRVQVLRKQLIEFEKQYKELASRMPDDHNKLAREKMTIDVNLLDAIERLGVLCGHSISLRYAEKSDGEADIVGIVPRVVRNAEGEITGHYPDGKRHKR